MTDIPIHSDPLTEYLHLSSGNDVFTPNGVVATPHPDETLPSSEADGMESSNSDLVDYTHPMMPEDLHRYDTAERNPVSVKFLASVVS